MAARAMKLPRVGRWTSFSMVMVQDGPFFVVFQSNGGVGKTRGHRRASACRQLIPYGTLNRFPRPGARIEPGPWHRTGGELASGHTRWDTTAELLFPPEPPITCSAGCAHDERFWLDDTDREQRWPGVFWLFRLCWSAVTWNRHPLIADVAGGWDVDRHGDESFQGQDLDGCSPWQQP